MTNWFKELGVTENDLREFFVNSTIVKNQSLQFKDVLLVELANDSNIAIIKGLCTDKKEGIYDVKKILCSPFFIHDQILDMVNVDTTGFKKYLDDRELANWMLRVKTQDFSSSPRAYYEIFLSRCTDEQKRQYRKELKEAYAKCAKDEIALLEEKASEIKTIFDKEIIARKRMLQMGSTRSIFGSTSAENNGDDIENE